MNIRIIHREVVVSDVFIEVKQGHLLWDEVPVNLYVVKQVLDSGQYLATSADSKYYALFTGKQFVLEVNND